MKFEQRPSEPRFCPPDEAKLAEGQRQFLEQKLAQYQKRVEDFEKRIDYLAPELVNDFQKYYASLAKMAAAELLLTGNATKQEVDAFVRNSAKEHWDDVYKDHPESASKVLSDHARVIREAIENGWSVVCAYNQGRMDALTGSQPV